MEGNHDSISRMVEQARSPQSRTVQHSEERLLKPYRPNALTFLICFFITINNLPNSLMLYTSETRTLKH